MKDDIVIRQAGIDEIDKVMLFLKENWGENHVLANSKELMCYEHAWNNEFTFILAEDSKTLKIYGVCGYIPYSDEKTYDVGIGIWKVIQNPHFMLGIELFRYVQQNIGCRMLADCGVNPKTKGHRKIMGHTNAKLNQYYRINALVETFSIAEIKDRKISHKKNNLSYKFVNLEDIDQFKKCFDITLYKDTMPYKDYNYINHRYYKHIKYQYKIMGIDNGKNVEAVVIGRDVAVSEKKAFRIIDFLGNEDFLSGTYDAWESFLTFGKYEYIDFYEYGLNPENLLNAGFFLREDNINIIPNYFDPFEKKNIEIIISTNMHQGFRMFKGDGDQDRPNSL